MLLHMGTQWFLALNMVTWVELTAEGTHQSSCATGDCNFMVILALCVVSKVFAF